MLWCWGAWLHNGCWLCLDPFKQLLEMFPLQRPPALAARTGQIAMHLLKPLRITDPAWGAISICITHKGVCCLGSEWLLARWCLGQMLFVRALPCPPAQIDKNVSCVVDLASNFSHFFARWRAGVSRVLKWFTTLHSGGHVSSCLTVIYFF